MLGKVAIVTGGGSGIGEATCQIFASHGAAVVVADRSEEHARAVASRIARNGHQAVAFVLDVTDEADVARLMDYAQAQFATINVLVNSAGIALSKTILDISESDWDDVMDINAKGTFLTTKHVIPHMQAAGGGSIVNIASVAANVGWAGFGGYCASKGAVRALTKAIAVAHGRDGIRANSIHPGVTETPMTRDALKASVERYAGSTLLGRFGKASEIANCCLFLASDESSYVTGSELIADGGTIAV